MGSARHAFLEHENGLGSGLCPDERNLGHRLPVQVAHALDDALRVIATDLPHAELFGALAKQSDLGNSLHSVAAGQGAIGIQTERERDVLYVLAVASNRPCQPALVWLGHRLGQSRITAPDFCLIRRGAERMVRIKD